jgi:hypothetical protein
MAVRHARKVKPVPGWKGNSEKAAGPKGFPETEDALERLSVVVVTRIGSSDGLAGELIACTPCTWG